MNTANQNIKIARAYYENGSKFAQLIFVDNELKETNYFKIENGLEIHCPPPESKDNFIIPMEIANNCENQKKLEVFDSKTGEIVTTMNQIEELAVIDGCKLIINSSDRELWENTIKPLEYFTKDEKEKIRQAVFNKNNKNENAGTLLDADQFKKSIETILSDKQNKIVPSFYKNINTSAEFGVSRFIADRMNYLPKLLENTVLNLIQDDTYLVSAELKDARGNSIKLEHRFKATSNEEAFKIYAKISHQMAGVQQKIWLACWSLANELGRHTFTCELTDLMKIAYTERKGYFSVNEKVEFYDHIKSLEQTKLGFSQITKKKNRKRLVCETFEIPLLQVHYHSGTKEGRYPLSLTLSILNAVPNPGAMAFVGAAFKKKTLELHADDIELATWIQTRKSQLKDEKFIRIDLAFLFKLAGLEKTAITNKRQAKKLLQKKLCRLCEKNILVSVPEKIEDPTLLTVR